jgi:hypothetical protein
MNWRPATSGMPFAGRTSYKVDFIDYGCNTGALYKVKQIPTVISELPFLSKTTYGDSYAKPIGGETREPAKMELFGKKYNAFYALILLDLLFPLLFLSSVKV